jgi:hypothetical protein
VSPNHLETIEIGRDWQRFLTNCRRNSAFIAALDFVSSDAA